MKIFMLTENNAVSNVYYLFCDSAGIVDSAKATKINTEWFDSDKSRADYMRHLLSQLDEYQELLDDRPHVKQDIENMTSQQLLDMMYSSKYEEYDFVLNAAYWGIAEVKFTS